MTSPGRYEADISSLIQWREGRDTNAVLMGIRLAGMRRRHRISVRRMGRDAGISKSSASEYARVAEMLVGWRGLAARSTLEDLPLTFTHLRTALRLPCEGRIDALTAAVDGDPAYPQFSAPMTPDEFGVYVAELGGKPVSAKPDGEWSGWGHEVIAEMMRTVRGWTGRVLVKIWRVE